MQVTPRPRRPARMRRKPLAAGVLLLATALAAAAQQRPPSIAAAASLRAVVPALVEGFRARSGHAVRVSYAATGKLTRQILRGAPFELLLAADPDYPQRLVDAGRTAGGGAVYARGRLALYLPEDSPVAAAQPLADLPKAIASGRVERFAIPNPQYAPYGRRARTALRAGGLWSSVQPVLVLGDNASQAAQFAAADQRSAGIVPAAFAHAPRFAEAGRFVDLPAAWYRPLAHRMVLIDDAGAVARAFHRFMQSERARRILRQHGFGDPREDR